MWFLGLFLLGLIPRLLIIASRPDGLEFWEYETLAQNIVGGQGYVIPRFGHLAYAFGDGNLYSFLSASVYQIVGHQPLVLAIVQAIIASLAPPVIFALGARAFSAPIAATGAALAALHPGLLAYTTKLHPLGLDVLLISLSVFWVGCAGNGLRSGLAAGFALGMTLMSRPTFFLAGVAALAVRWRASLVRRPLPLIAALAIAALLACPWVVRNWVVLGRPMFISTSLEDVWKGNNPLASGSSYLPSGQDVFAAAPPELQARLEQSNELALNDVFGAEVVDFVSQHPGDFVGLVVRKFAFFWWLSPQAGLFYPAAWLTAYSWYAAAIFCFAIVGAVAIVRRGSLEERHLLGMLGAIALTLAVIHALAYVEGRHRWGVEPLLLLLTARGIFAVAAALRRPLRRMLPA
jgi:4-amino-4-deoxy-L-arabinose transferase-like glycosyltransferase